MKIKLLSLELKNFKGTKEALYKFGDFTEVEGKNGTGKSTIFDAFCWVLFGKDSTDRKVFSVQPYDENNNVIHHLDTIVTATLEIDGTIKTFKRTLKEKLAIAERENAALRYDVATGNKRVRILEANLATANLAARQHAAGGSTSASSVGDGEGAELTAEAGSVVLDILVVS